LEIHATMTTSTILFCVTCSTEDPQVLARVLGVFAARSILPLRFSSLWAASPERIEVEAEITAGEGVAGDYLARVLDRIPTVTSVKLVVDGCDVVFDPLHNQ
jgi:hypothetical protein